MVSHDSETANSFSVPIPLHQCHSPSTNLTPLLISVPISLLHSFQYQPHSIILFSANLTPPLVILVPINLYFCIVLFPAAPIISGAEGLSVIGGQGPVFLYNMVCSGSETSIFDCPRNSQVEQSFLCVNHLFDAGVICDSE